MNIILGRIFAESGKYAYLCIARGPSRWREAPRQPNLTYLVKDEEQATSASGEPPVQDATAPARDVAGDAVGVPRWYVAVVTNNNEKAVAGRLADMGHEVFVAMQPTLRVWRNGRKAMVDKVIIPTFVFVRCTEAERRQIVALPYIRRFLADRARAVKGMVAPPAVIAQREIDTLRFMLGQSDYPVELTQSRYRPGDKVRVIRGALLGLEGEVLRPADGPGAPDAELVVRLDILGAARVTVPLTDIAPAP